MPCNLFVVCLLLMVAAELMEGRSAFHSRKVQRSAVQSHFQSIKRQSELPECNRDEFLCVNQSRCIPDKYVCDGDDDCHDWSDEPGNCLTRDCPDGYVKCSNGQCLKLTSYCSEEVRCRRAANVVTDFQCSPSECQSDQLFCADPAKCISQSNICDGFNDCSDGSDEQNCEQRVCADDELRCNSGQCINKASYCMSNSSCRDFTRFDEACLDFTCPPDNVYFKCRSNGLCIANSSRCDGIGNCVDRSDETECACAADEFKCNSGKCIKKLAYCVFSYSCSDNTDLSRVCIDFTCPPEFQLFQCQSDGKCIRNGLRCNGMVNCVDGSDETDC